MLKHQNNMNDRAKFINSDGNNARKTCQSEDLQTNRKIIQFNPGGCGLMTTPFKSRDSNPH